MRPPKKQEKKQSGTSPNDSTGKKKQWTRGGKGFNRSEIKKALVEASVCSQRILSQEGGGWGGVGRKKQEFGWGVRFGMGPHKEGEE